MMFRLEALAARWLRSRRRWVDELAARIETGRADWLDDLVGAITDCAETRPSGGSTSGRTRSRWMRARTWRGWMPNRRTRRVARRSQLCPVGSSG